MDLADVVERTQWDWFWVPADVRLVDRPELLYAVCPRDVPMLNCVTRTRAPAEALPALVAEVGEAHQRVCSRWLVRDAPWAQPLARSLAEAGWAPAVPTDARAIAVTAYHPRPLPALEVRRVQTMAELRDAVTVIDRAFPGGLEYTQEQYDNDLAQCCDEAARVQRFVAYRQGSGEPIATGGMTLFRELGFGYLWAGCTVVEARGHGAYSALVAARVERARLLGLSHVGLYAITTTSSPIVARQGFARVGSMTYWERPAAH